MRDLREVLKDEVDRRMISTTKLAKRAGISPQQLGEILARLRGLSVTAMFKVCNALEIEPNELWKRAQEDTAPDDRDTL